MSANQRRFSNLRDLSERNTHNITENAAVALEVFADTPHGDAFKEYLASLLCDVSSPSSESAWRELHARRQFAAELLAMMEGKHERRKRRGEHGDSERE